MACGFASPGKLSIIARGDGDLDLQQAHPRHVERGIAVRPSPVATGCIRRIHLLTGAEPRIVQPDGAPVQHDPRQRDPEPSMVIAVGADKRRYEALGCFALPRCSPDFSPI